MDWKNNLYEEKNILFSEQMENEGDFCIDSFHLWREICLN